MVEHFHGGVLKWIELHPGTASWVQALGAIAAIGAAFWIAQAQQRQAAREAREDRSTRARALSYRIFPAVAAIKREVRRVRSVAGARNYGMLMVQAGANAASTEAEAIIAMSIKERLSAKRLLDNLYLLEGEAPKTVSQIAWLVATYNDFIERTLGGGVRYGSEERKRLIEHCAPRRLFRDYSASSDASYVDAHNLARAFKALHALSISCEARPFPLQTDPLA